MTETEGDRVPGGPDGPDPSDDDVAEDAVAEEDAAVLTDDGIDDDGAGGAGDGDGTPEAKGEPPLRARELVLLAVAVFAVGAAVFLGVRWKELYDAENQRDEVEEAASEFLGALFEWDGTTIDADFDRILDHATGDFAQEAAATFNDDEIRQALRENRAGSRVGELDTFTRSIDGDMARVFAVVDQTAANREFPEGRSDTVRIEIGMTRDDGEWKVFDVNVIDGLSLGLPSVPGG